MDCRRSLAVDDDRSRRIRWVVDDDRRRRRWAVDDDRSRIAFYQNQVKASLDRMDILCVNFMEKIMNRSATIPAPSSQCSSNAHIQPASVTPNAVSDPSQSQPKSDDSSMLSTPEKETSSVARVFRLPELPNPHVVTPVPGIQLDFAAATPPLPPARTELPPSLANQQPIIHASLERSQIRASPTLILPPDSSLLLCSSSMPARLASCSSATPLPTSAHITTTLADPQLNADFTFASSRDQSLNPDSSHDQNNDSDSLQRDSGPNTTQLLLRSYISKLNPTSVQTTLPLHNPPYDFNPSDPALSTPNQAYRQIRSPNPKPVSRDNGFEIAFVSSDENDEIRSRKKKYFASDGSNTDSFAFQKTDKNKEITCAQCHFVANQSQNCKHEEEAVAKFENRRVNSVDLFILTSLSTRAERKITYYNPTTTIEEQEIEELDMRPGGFSSLHHITDLKVKDMMGLFKKEVRNTPFWYYAFNKSFKEFVLAFDELSEKDIVSWTEISAASTKKGLVIECLRPFRAMIDSGIEPEGVFISWMLLEGVKSSSSTILNVISACSHITALDLGKCLHGSIKEMSLESDVTSRAAIFDEYAKCGHLKTSRALRESLHPLLRQKLELQEEKLNAAVNLLALELTDKFSNATPSQSIATDYSKLQCITTILTSIISLSQPVVGWKAFVPIFNNVFNLYGAMLMARENDHFLKQYYIIDKHQREILLLRHDLQTARAGIEFIQMNYLGKVQVIGKHMHRLTNAVSSYYTVFAENKKLYNQVRDLKGSIWVYCRVRSLMLPGQMNSSIVGMYRRCKIFDPGGLLIFLQQSPSHDAPQRS